MNKKGILIVICGPSGVGKGTICKKFLTKNTDIKLSISATTRSPRAGEEHGVSYYFLDAQKFEDMIEKDEFLEYARVYDNGYGTPKKAVFENLEKGEDVLLEIDIQGAMQVKEKYPDGVFIFILPPSLEELKNRIVKRGSETEESFKKRFGSAFSEISKIENFDYYLVNNDLDKAVGQLESIIMAEKNRVSRYKDCILKKFEEEL
ncbi:guanylate kinase [Peptoclostridium litorale DSM 5388]|uniref:Guanylate kinase n=1 Tax=Peptoclostridium litorale DSM 5388 TaxID=1121324 RepID=A0A069RAC5_PEPLI|nr:guanylate kinase [Peptoclostridium litorale]KDR94024.1 guanylate kinase Gmk [Peptoclostridium litorale DSM 5388]SIN79768.1 guanylate kinase [Peptoclostridium litorale DSM 5388]